MTLHKAWIKRKKMPNLVQYKEKKTWKKSVQNALPKPITQRKK